MTAPALTCSQCGQPVRLADVVTRYVGAHPGNLGGDVIQHLRIHYGIDHATVSRTIHRLTRDGLLVDLGLQGLAVAPGTPEAAP